MPRSSSRHRVLKRLAVLILCGTTIFLFLPHIKNTFLNLRRGTAQSKNIGESLASYRGVHVFHNGNNYSISHGKHYSKDHYYFGQKWQCVEFVKRFYFEAHNHRMPDVWGHAKDYFDPKIPHGQINPQRGMTQYQNSGAMKPKVDDLLVFNDSSYGHVAIISSVSDSEIEVIQQNVIGIPKTTLPLKTKNAIHTIGTKRKPVGWLRLEKTVAP